MEYNCGTCNFRAHWLSGSCITCQTSSYVSIMLFSSRSRRSSPRCIRFLRLALNKQKGMTKFHCNEANWLKWERNKTQWEVGSDSIQAYAYPSFACSLFFFITVVSWTKPPPQRCPWKFVNIPGTHQCYLTCQKGLAKVIQLGVLRREILLETPQECSFADTLTLTQWGPFQTSGLWNCTIANLCCLMPLNVWKLLLVAIGNQYCPSHCICIQFLSIILLNGFPMHPRPFPLNQNVTMIFFNYLL